MLKGYIWGLDSDSLPFTITDTQDIILNAPNDPTLRWTRTVISKEILNGQLHDGRYIKFFGCRYDGYSLSVQGYVYAVSDYEPDELIDFSQIMFTGKAIDNLSGGVFGGFEREGPEQYEKRMYGITPRPWNEINRFYPSEIANRKCTIGIDHSIMYNLQWGERQIGTYTPRFVISFEEPVGIERIPELYLGVYDFFVFLNFRRSITFDSISLWKTNERGKTIKTAAVVLFSNRKELRQKCWLEAVTLEDLGEDFGRLFHSIASRRPNGILDDLFIPEDETDYVTVNPTSFLSCALSFEGEYDRTEPRKTDCNQQFKQVKELAADTVIHHAAKCAGLDEAELKKQLLCAIEKDFDGKITALCANLSNTQARKVLRYAKNMLDTLEKVDYNLEEQFNNTLRKFSSIIEPFQLRAAERMGIEFSDKTNLGAIFAECRNKIGHGHPEPLESIHAYVFVLGRCLTYIMILQSAHIDKERIASIFNKLFR